MAPDGIFQTTGTVYTVPELSVLRPESTLSAMKVRSNRSPQPGWSSHKLQAFSGHQERDNLFPLGTGTLELVLSYFGGSSLFCSFNPLDKRGEKERKMKEIPE